MRAEVLVVGGGLGGVAAALVAAPRRRPAAVAQRPLLAADRGARPDGGTGWPGLRLRGDVTGGTDGLAQAPYIRESRRIQAEYTVVEHDLSLAVQGDRGAVSYPDSVGVGMYRIDLHPTTGGDNYLDIGCVSGY